MFVNAEWLACLPGCSPDYLRLGVEKLDLRVVPVSLSLFFFFLLPHTALCTPDHAQTYLKLAWWQGKAGERKNVWREGGLVLFHSHLHSGFSCLFQPPPAETFSAA